jgi:hypothetical protein
MPYLYTQAKASLFALSLIAIGCGQMQEVMQKSQDIQRSLASQCDCEDVRMINYSIENFTASAHYELVGCQFESLEKESKRITDFLKKDIPGFCEIDDFTVDFINKGEHQVVRLKDCKTQ